MTLFRYNPIDIRYKSTCGAVELNTPVTFTVEAHIDTVIDQMFLTVKSDEKGSVSEYLMVKGKAEKNYYKYSVTVAFDKVGLFWYCFTAHANGMSAKIGIDGAKQPRLYYGNAPYYQLTVYEKVYQSPNWLQDGVMYQIFPDRFCKYGETYATEDKIIRHDWGATPYFKPVNGQVKCNDFFGGNIKGIISKLDYLMSLNVTTIYLNPIFTAYSNHKYDTEDYESVDPMFGTNEDFETLCRSAKQRGISVVLDGVFNHSGVDSKYFNRAGKYNTVGAYQSKNSPYYDWFIFTDWDKRKYKTWWGFDTLPQHNPNSKSLQNYFAGENGIIAKWIRLGARGFRLDVVDEIADSLLDPIVESAKRTLPDACVIGEVWEDGTNKIAYGQRRKYFLGKQLDSVMNYCLKDAIIEFVRNKNEKALSFVMFDLLNNYPKHALNNLMCLLDSHDTLRAITAVGGKSFPKDTPKEAYENISMTDGEYEWAEYLLKMCALLQYTLIGFPSLYYGDEVGMQGYVDPLNRVCFPWDNINFELLEFYKKLGQFRKHGALKNGVFTELYAKNGCYVYSRSNECETIIVGVNRGDAVDVKIKGSYENLFDNGVNKDVFHIQSNSFFIAKSI